MEQVPCEGYQVLLLLSEFDFCGVKVGVQFAADGQSCGCGGVRERLTMVW
jgi:hypothetical protein